MVRLVMTEWRAWALIVAVFVFAALVIASIPAVPAIMFYGLVSAADEYRNPVTGGYCCTHEDKFKVPADAMRAIDGGYRIELAPYGTPYIYIVPASWAQPNRNDGHIWLYVERMAPSKARCLLIPATT